MPTSIEDKGHQPPAAFHTSIHVRDDPIRGTVPSQRAATVSSMRGVMKMSRSVFFFSTLRWLNSAPR